MVSLVKDNLVVFYDLIVFKKEARGIAFGRRGPIKKGTPASIDPHQWGYG